MEVSIIRRARMGSESIVDEAETEWAIDSEATRNNFLSKIQLVGQKTYRDKKKKSAS